MIKVFISRQSTTYPIHAVRGLSSATLSLSSAHCWQQSQPSRIINVSSLAHRYGKIKKVDLNSDKSYSEVHCYSQSKLANVLFTRELARRLKDSRVTVNALHPGAVNTELTRHVGKITVFLPVFLVKAVAYLFFKTAKAGAQTTIYAGTRNFVVEEAFLDFHSFSSRSKFGGCYRGILCVSDGQAQSWSELELNDSIFLIQWMR